MDRIFQRTWLVSEQFACKRTETQTSLTKYCSAIERVPLNYNYSVYWRRGGVLFFFFWSTLLLRLNLVLQKWIYSSEVKSSTFGSLEFSDFLPLFSYCVCPTIQHLSAFGWMNSSIQRHYYAERRVKGRMGRSGRWEKSRACATPHQSVCIQPFNSLSPAYKSLTHKSICLNEGVFIPADF